MDYFDDTSDLEERIHTRLINEFEWNPDAPRFGYERELEEKISRFISDEQVMLSSRAHTQLVRRLLDRIVGLGPIERYIRNPNVTEIMVNGPDSIWVQKRGEEAPTQVWDVSFRNEDEVRHVIEQIVNRAGKGVDQAHPTVDARLSDGSRVNAVVPPVSLNGPVLTIRKFVRQTWSLAELEKPENGGLPHTIAQFLQTCIEGRLSILVSGGTNSGKTTTLNAVSSHIPDGERIITIEDTAELQLTHKNLVRMEARPPNSEGAGEITIRDLVRNALRMRPDRIIVGECRGAEALDMLQAMNTGHDGSLTTIHANSPEDAMSRLETMSLMATSVNLPLSAVREQIRGSLRLVLQQRFFADGKRRIVSVSEVIRDSPASQSDAPVEVRPLYVFKRLAAQNQKDVHGYWECVGAPTELLHQLLAVRGVRLNPSLLTPGHVD